LTNETAPSVDSIRTAAYNAFHASGADASVTYIDLKSGATFSLDGGNSRSSASVIKLLVLAALLDSVHAGTHTLDESLTVSNADMVGGTGVISDMGVGDYTLRSLATYMITDSDNIATNKIIGLLGMENINAEAAQLGLPNTRLERLMMDEAAIAAISAAIWDARI
jgi:beta-lactamase class A